MDAIIDAKVCCTCKRLKFDDEFYNHTGKLDRLFAECKSCANKRTVSWRNKNKEKNKKDQFYRNVKKYGISKIEYDKLFESQNGKCAICYRNKKLVIDHNHKNNKVRALLCYRCNLLLGKVNDDISLLLKAADYLFRNGE